MLTEQQTKKLMGEVVAKVGCPVTIQDRLGAFAAGMQAAVFAVAPMVSMDGEDNDALKEQN